jgi:hypothetical protein
MWAGPAAAVLALGTPAASAAPVQVELAGPSGLPTIVFADGDGAPLQKAAALLAHDVGTRIGRLPAVVADGAGARGTGVIVGRADTPYIAALLRANGLDAGAVRGKWEVYGRAWIKAPWNPGRRALLIYGSDVRGAIWGVTDLSREIGVSPWEWWADVHPRHADRLLVDATPRVSRTPTVKFRGIFLNAGENGLTPWAARTFNPAQKGIGPKTYARIYELMWRLKANLIWPAMTNEDIPFNAVPENYKVAADYAIVRGSSHVEMLLRNNPHEWDPKTMGPYNWRVNRERMIAYWREAVHRFGGNENIYTVGLRNVDDFPMQGADDPKQMAAILSDVIAAQRRILSEELHKPADQIPQVFTLYKEILPAYDTGLLKLPGDITLNWAEDDFGYVRRLSDAKERQRPGGSGIYYHNVFWGPPMSYLWLDAIDPSLMREEMTKAVRFDARGQWILNVGSIKPCEFMTELFLAMGFDADAFKDGESVHRFLRGWVEEQFGGAEADAITAILWRYYKLAFDRNPEFMGWTQVFPETPIAQTAFNMRSFGDENARRADAYRALMAEAKAVMERLPADRRDAFFQLVRYPVDIAGDLNLRQLALDKSIAYGLQHRASADAYAAEAGRAHAALASDTDWYNNVMSGGKWRGMMNPYPHDLPIYEPPHLPTWSSGGDTRCGVQVEGGGYFDGAGWWTPTLPAFHPELQRQHYLDVFVEGRLSTGWSATPSVPWIKVSKAAGSLSPATGLEDRLQVSIDWARAPAGGKGDVTVRCGTALQPMAVHVELAPANRAAGVSFIEADRIVAMNAVHADAMGQGWERIDGLGHVGADLRSRLDRPSLPGSDAASLAQAPHASYRFATTTADDLATLRVIALPTFPLTAGNKLRVAVSIDGGSPVTLPLDAPEFSQAWREHVLTNNSVAEVNNLRLAPGAHRLEVWALDPGVVLDRFELAFAGAERAYGPVPETRLAAADKAP